MLKRYAESGPAAKTAIFVATLAAMYAVFWLLYQNHLSAGILVGSIALHEFGHLAAYHYYGHRGGIIFLPPLGAVMVPSDFEKAKKMHLWQKAVTAFAGPGVNIAIAIVGAAMTVSASTRSFGLMLIALNGSLAAFNLLPFSIFDGGHIAQALFESADEAGDQRILKTVRMAMLGCFAAIVLMGQFSLMPILFIWRITKAADEDDPLGYLKPEAMRHRQVMKMTRWFTLAALASLFVASVFRYWNDYR